jgi:hypothetical protein
MSTAPSLKNSAVLEFSQCAPSGETSVDYLPPSTISNPQRKQSGRVCIGITVQVSGTDLNGQDFLERTQTEHVSRSGACLLLNRFLGPDQQLTIRRPGNKTETVARVIGQVGIRQHGYVYGISLCGESDANFWGVHFPPSSADERHTLLRCTCCHKSERVALNEIEAGVLGANGILSRSCEECKAATFWQALPKQTVDQGSVAVAAQGSPGEAKVSRRKNIRTSMRASACVSQPTGARDVAPIIDISRGGIAFRSSNKYPVHSWVELAAPYTEGGANIFVAGRIVWQRSTLTGSHEYGVQYVKN